MTNNMEQLVEIRDRFSLLTKGLIKQPRQTLRETDGSLIEWGAAWLLLGSIVLVNTLLSLMFGRDGLGAQLWQTLTTVVPLSLVVSGAAWVALAGIVDWRGSWFRLHTGTIIVMVPLALGPLPFIGPVAVLFFAGSLMLLMTDLGEQSVRRALPLALLVIMIAVLFAMVKARFLGAV